MKEFLPNKRFDDVGLSHYPQELDQNVQENLKANSCKVKLFYQDTKRDKFGKKLPESRYRLIDGVFIPDPSKSENTTTGVDISTSGVFLFSRVYINSLDIVFNIGDTLGLYRSLYSITNVDMPERILGEEVGSIKCTVKMYS